MAGLEAERTINLPLFFSSQQPRFEMKDWRRRGGESDLLFHRGRGERERTAGRGLYPPYLREDGSFKLF